MTLDEKLALSYYQEVAVINESHQVFLVQHTVTHKFYVKKVLSVYNRSVFETLKSHPIFNTPKLYEVVESDESLIVIEEYIPGDTLQEILKKQQVLSEPEVLHIMLQLCPILESLHHCTPPIIHRDLKPSNIMQTPDGILKLLDMNAAKFENSVQDKDTSLLGTHGFAAPEQYGFGSSQIQTDIYSIGILMNLLLTGILSHKCTISNRLAPVIETCIKLDPKDRYQSVEALQQELFKLTSISSIPSPKQTQRPSWKQFIPPGFRSRNPIFVLLALIGYTIIFWLGFTIVFQSAPSTASLVAERITTTIMLLSMVCFTCNYLNIQSQFPLCHHKNIGVRLFGIVFYNAVIAFLGMLLMLLSEAFLK